MELLSRTCNTERMNVERLVARIFVALGGLFWVAAVFGANFAYEDKALSDSLGSALIPLAITIVALAIGWFYEVLASLLLTAGAVGVIVYGAIVPWDNLGIWITMSAVLIAPMLIAALLFMLASRMQKICTLEEQAT